MPKLPGKRVKKNVRKFTLSTAHGSGDLVSIQISCRLHRVPKGLKITKQLLASMIKHKALTSSGYWDAGSQSVIGAREGENPPGITLNIIRWRNPGRNRATDRGWRSGDSQADAWGSLWQPIANSLINVR